MHPGKKCVKKYNDLLQRKRTLKFKEGNETESPLNIESVKLAINYSEKGTLALCE